MTINPKNIDQWLFNYYEGNLSPSEVKQLESFLKKNPDYYEDAHAWKDSFVEEAVPVFNASFLVKEIDTKADRKRFALAMFALLLIGSFSALYLASTNSNGPTTNNNSTTTDKTATKNNTVANNNNKPKTTNYNSNTNTATYSSARVNNPANANVVRNTPIVQVNPNTNPNPVNTHANNVNNTHVNNVLAHAPSINNVTISNPPTYVAPIINNNANISLVTQNANTTINGNTNLVNSNPVNSEILNTTSIIAPDPLATNNATVIETPNSFNPEPIIVNNELVVVNTESIENINMTLGEPLANNGKEQEVPSEFNPDKFVNDKKADDLNKSSNEVVVDNNKKDIKTENGIRFGNLRNVSLLQGINSEFQTNGSFITQHYRTDGYLTGNYRQTTSGEYSSNMMAGYSYLIRKYRASINMYGHYTTTSTYQNAGFGLQAALNLKLDRFNFLVPSMTVTFDQYSFSGSYDNSTLPSIAMPSKSYFSQELTGKFTIPDYANANHVNVSTGLVYHHKKYYLGVAFNGLLQPKFRYTTETSSREQFATNTATINLIAGTDFISKKYPEFSVSPQVIVEIRNMEPVVTGGTVFKYKNWAAGLGVSSKGALNTYFGFSHRAINLQYRYMVDKVDAAFGNLSGHYITTHINLKGLSKKQKTYLDDDK